MVVENGRDSRRTAGNSWLVIDLEPSDTSAPSDVNRMASHRGDGHGSGRENASSARAEVPGESHVTANEADGQEILVVGIDLLADEKEQSNLTGIVRDKVEFHFEMVADERRRCQTQVRRVSHERAIELRPSHVHRCARFVQSDQLANESKSIL